MSSAEIPRIRSIPNSVAAGVGDDLRIYIQEDDSQTGPTERPCEEMINDVVEQMFTREGIPYNRDLQVACMVGARIATAKLATASGVTVEFSDGTSRELRPEDTGQTTK